MNVKTPGMAVARWLGLIVGVGATLTCLNGVMGNAWAAGFHDPYRDAYLHRAFLCIWYGAGALLLTVALFLGLRAVRRNRIVVALVAAGLTAFAVPHVRAFLLVDRCLDGGGRWDSATFKCEH
jgi:hypothetical protein